jgi:hypothetical protein
VGAFFLWLSRYKNGALRFAGLLLLLHLLLLQTTEDGFNDGG